MCGRLAFPEEVCACGEELKSVVPGFIHRATDPDGRDVATAYCPNCAQPYTLVEVEDEEEEAGTPAAPLA